MHIFTICRAKRFSMEIMLVDESHEKSLNEFNMFWSEETSHPSALSYDYQFRACATLNLASSSIKCTFHLSHMVNKLLYTFYVTVSLICSLNQEIIWFSLISSCNNSHDHEFKRHPEMCVYVRQKVYKLLRMHATSTNLCMSN